MGRGRSETEFPRLGDLWKTLLRGRGTFCATLGAWHKKIRLFTVLVVAAGIGSTALMIVALFSF
jgi:hypothetical protein